MLSYLEEQIRIKEALWGCGGLVYSNKRESLCSQRYGVRNNLQTLCIEPSLVPCGPQHTFVLNYSLICLSVCGGFALSLGPGEWKEGDPIVPTPGSRADTLPRRLLLLGSVRETCGVGI